MAELGNLIARILHPLERMSTVKIRAGSRFHTCLTRIGPSQAVFGPSPEGFPTPSTILVLPAQDVHRPPAFPACARQSFRCKVKGEEFSQVGKVGGD